MRDAGALAVAERVLVEGYPMPGTPPGSVLAPGLLGGPTRVWVGYVDGEPASVAAAHTAAGTTLVEYVAALPAARGRAPVLRSPGQRPSPTPGRRPVLVASDDGRPTYESMGYLPLERWTAWLRPSASGPRTGRTVSG